MTVLARRRADLRAHGFLDRPFLARGSRVLLALGLVLLGSSCRQERPGIRAPSATWETLKDCRFDPAAFHDGDSFHVICGGERFVFRLYFVDAPEWEGGVPEQVREQCRYFGVTRSELRVVAERARALVVERLRDGFRVTTRWQDAMGRTKRYAALVETANGEDLGELLVREGLARVKGFRAILPDGTPAKEHLARLKELERQAKRERRGAWAYSNKLSKPDRWQWLREWWQWLSRLFRREGEAARVSSVSCYSPRYTHRAVQVSATITCVSSGRRGLSRSQIQRAMFSLVAFSRPGMSLR